MRSKSITLPVLLVALYWVVVAGIASAQTDYDTSPGAQTGQQAYGSYFNPSVDSVGLYNGNLNVVIPLFTIPGRELPVTLSAVYNSQKWEEEDCGGYDCGFYAGGWTVSAGKTELSMFAVSIGGGDWELNAYWIDGRGTKHRYRTESNDNDFDEQTLESVDGDGSVLETYIDTHVSKITFRDGTHLLLKDGNYDEEEYYYDVMTPNGNYIEYDSYALPVQDTVGRTIERTTFDPAGPDNYGWRYTVTDANGEDQDYDITWTELEVWDPHLDDEVELDYITSILLPNGKSYQFEYDYEQGLLTKLILPSGAYTRYVYPTTYTNASNDYVKDRYVSADGTAGSEKRWQYSGMNSRTEAKTVTVISPEGDKVVHKFNSTGTEYETLWQTASGTTLKKVFPSWSQDEVHENGQPENPVVNEITTFLDSNMWSKKSFTYDDDDYLTQEEQTEWTFGEGYGTGEVVFQRNLTYTPTTGAIKHVASETIKAIDPVSGSLADQGKTEYAYDEYSLTVRSGSIPNHSGDTSASDRGNVTTIKRYKDATNYVTEHIKYDNLGNVVEKIDPLSHSTYLDWTDDFTDQTSRDSYAYLTKTTNPLSQYATSTYDFNTGLVVNTTNLRGYTTTTEYDLMNRVTSVTEPNGKETAYSYDDTNRITTKTVTVDSLGNLGRVKTYFDGLYRVIQTRTNDPEGEIYVDTEYDGNGRPKRTTNPYRSGGSQLWTTSAYDALSRPLTVTAPDISLVTYAYENNWTTLTDQAGNVRRYTYDVVGKMTMVEEPDPTQQSPLVTTYTYYAFGPLYGSDQGGQVRTFVHNWLGQKTSEALPEFGTTTFSYDDAGRMTSKTDARSTTTTLTYDNASRLTQRSYSDSTPTVSYGYDSGGLTGLKTSMTDGLGSVAYAYDTMNRMTQETRTLTGISGTFSTEYEYNIKGDITEVTYPSGRVVEINYATGGGCCNSRLASVVDQTTSTTLASSISYDPAGNILDRTLGNSFVESFAYNSRVQLTSITAVKTSTTYMSFSYNYGTSSENTGRVLARSDIVQPRSFQ